MMNEAGKYSKLSFIYAIVVHVVVFMLLCVSLSFNRMVVKSNIHPSKVIQAIAVNQKEVQRKVAEIKGREKAEHDAEVAAQKRKERLARQAAELKLRQKRMKEKRLAEQREAKKKLAEKKKQQKAQVAHRNKLATKTKKTAQTNMENLLEDQLAREQQLLANAHNRQLQSEIAKYKALISNTISQNWIIPGHLGENLSTQLLIHLAPGGIVLAVKVLKSSGKEVLDRSAMNAVWKSSPLPVPTDSTIFEEFRKLRLTATPQGLLAG